MSTTHLVFGSLAVKARARWLHTKAGRTPERFFRQRRFCGTPDRSAPAVNRAIRFKLAVSPS